MKTEVRCSYCKVRFDPNNHIWKEDEDYVKCPVCQQVFRVQDPPRIPPRHDYNQYEGVFPPNHRELPQRFKNNHKQGI